MEEQAAGSARTLSMLKNVQETTSQVRNGADVMHRRSVAIHDDMEKLKGISAEVAEKVSAMRSASSNIAVFLDSVRNMGK